MGQLRFHNEIPTPSILRANRSFARKWRKSTPPPRMDWPIVRKAAPPLSELPFTCAANWCRNTGKTGSTAQVPAFPFKKNTQSPLFSFKTLIVWLTDYLLYIEVVVVLKEFSVWGNYRLVFVKLWKKKNSCLFCGWLVLVFINTDFFLFLNVWINHVFDVLMFGVASFKVSSKSFWIVWKIEFVPIHTHQIVK